MSGNAGMRFGSVLRKTVSKQMIRSPIAAALTVGLASSIRSEKRTLGVATPNDHIFGRYEHAMRFALVDFSGCWAGPNPR